jgi:hypothetical protein
MGLRGCQKIGCRVEAETKTASRIAFLQSFAPPHRRAVEASMRMRGHRRARKPIFIELQNASALKALTLPLN